ncbi:hypothetical protein EAF58_22645 [Escherichia coli]|nr:hypothetical protein [Escherichia coli]
MQCALSLLRTLQIKQPMKKFTPICFLIFAQTSMATTVVSVPFENSDTSIQSELRVIFRPWKHIIHSNVPIVSFIDVGGGWNELGTFRLDSSFYKDKFIRWAMNCPSYRGNIKLSVQTKENELEVNDSWSFSDQVLIGDDTVSIFVKPTFEWIKSGSKQTCIIYTREQPSNTENQIAGIELVPPQVQWPATVGFNPTNINVQSEGSGDWKTGPVQLIMSGHKSDTFKMLSDKPIALEINGKKTVIDTVFKFKNINQNVSDSIMIRTPLQISGRDVAPNRITINAVIERV